MEPTTFVAASLSLLAAPGPTNALLVTSGAAIGVRRSLPALAASLCGYLTAILLLRTALDPVLAAVPASAAVLRIAVAAYLIYLAFKLWRQASADDSRVEAVTLSQIFVATLLNPKGLIFAFAILPQEIDLLALAPWIAVLAVEIVAIGFGWILAGSLLQRGFRDVAPKGFGYRLSAVALAMLAVAVSAHAFR